MAVQQASNLSNKPFILAGPGYQKAGTFAQIGARSGDIEYGTVVSYAPATGLWHPFRSAGGTDGTQTPKGIVLATIAEADLKAGAVDDVPVLIGNALIDSEQLVVENSLTLATVITVPTNCAQNVEDALRNVGIFMTTTIDTTETA
jgi:hypothetical protein